MKTKTLEFFVSTLEIPGGDKQQIALLQKLNENETFRKEYEALEHIKTSLENYQPDFSKHFTQRVMQKLRLETDAKRRQKQLFRIMLKISMSAAAAVLILLLYVFWQDNALNIDSLLGITGLKSDDFANLLASY